MDRMSPLDAAFFFNESRRTPLHIASVSVLEGPAPGLGELTALALAKLEQLPRYRQRVRTAPLGIGRPFWADDERFDLTYHLHQATLPAPGGPGEFRETASRILAQPLDMRRSPWEIWLVDGLAEDRWALVTKVHHCVVDGVGAADMMTTLFDLEPTPRKEPVPQPWQPEHAPSRVSLLGGALRDAVSEPLNGLTGLIRGLGGRPDIRGFLAGLSRSLEPAARATPGSLNRPIGRHRRWAELTADLAETKAIRSALGGTVNDVVLAAAAHGLRELLATRDDLTDTTVVRALVPVSVRGEDEHGVLTNRVSAVIVDLPCHEPDPVRRLHLIRDQTDDLKHTHQAAGGDLLIRIAGLAPALLSLESRAAMAIATPLFQTVVTNIPGPRFPLYVLGRRVIGLYPYVPIAAGAHASIGVVSYLGRLYFGITGDFDSASDLDVLGKGIEAGFTELHNESRLS